MSFPPGFCESLVSALSDRRRFAVNWAWLDLAGIHKDASFVISWNQSNIHSDCLMCVYKEKCNNEGKWWWLRWNELWRWGFNNKVRISGRKSISQVSPSPLLLLSLSRKLISEQNLYVSILLFPRDDCASSLLGWKCGVSINCIRVFNMHSCQKFCKRTDCCCKIA